MVTRCVQGDSCTTLRDKVTSELSDHFTDLDTLWNSPVLVALDFKAFWLVLSSSRIRVRSENTVFCAIVAWYVHDKTVRKQHVWSLLHQIRWPLLTKQFVLDVVICCPWRDSLTKFILNHQVCVCGVEES